MLIKASNVIGLKVVSLDKGETIDEVEDVIYDAKAEKVIAFLINQGGWSASAQVIPF
ncbi:MAG: PRC-barrel domain-containing protein, partial [Patescibacteria group bacterium]